jgi:2-methylcitrate dehydratase PrpD
MDNQDEKAAINSLINNILDTKFENFDRDTVEKAKDRIIDTLGCLIGGANAPGNSGLIDLVRDWGGKEEATILIHDIKAPAYNVAMVNCIMARSYDFEPVSPLVEKISWPGHVSGTTVPTALTIGEVKGIPAMSI